MALLPDAPGRYRLFDPATKARTTLDAASAAALEPEAYQIYRPLPEKANRAATLLGFALAGRGRDIAMVLAAGCAATLLGMFTPQATALLVDRAIPDADTPMVWQIGPGSSWWRHPPLVPGRRRRRPVGWCSKQPRRCSTSPVR